METPTVPASLAETPVAAQSAEQSVEAPKSLLSDEPKVDAPAPFDAEKLTLPEGFDKTEANSAYIGYVALAKDIGLSHDQAQKLVDFHLTETQKATSALESSWTQTQDAWISEVKADKEIGNLDVLRQTIAKVTDNSVFTDPKFKEAMALTGAGNHPAVLRTLFRWAKALGEGSAVMGMPPARSANGQLDRTQISPAAAIYGPDGPATGGPKLART